MSDPSRASAGAVPADTAYRIQQPRPPLEEEYDPIIEDCSTNQTVLVLPNNSNEPELRTVSIIKTANPNQAYVIIPSKDIKDLSHHGPGWGYVCFGVRLPMIPGAGNGVTLFQEPTREAAELVAIKCLNKAVVENGLLLGNPENPYKEIKRMQEIGDNIHVLQCIEALQDEEYLYIVMPYCEQESLVERIPWGRGMVEEEAKSAFKQVLENIRYLRSHGICHRDLSPDNCMVYRGRVVLTDLAMSFRIPETGYVTPLGGFGKPAFLPPEVYKELPFNAVGCDLWSSGVILFNLLAGAILYNHPEPKDLMFRYFILAGGLSRSSLNERTVEVLMELEEAERAKICQVAMKCMSLSQDAMDLLEGMLTINPLARWPPEFVESCPWLTNASS